MTQAPTTGHASGRTPGEGRVGRGIGRLTARPTFARYGVVGVFNTLLDIGLFTLFAVVVGLSALWANVVSTCITLCLSYTLNRWYVFRSDRSHVTAFVPFVAVTLFSGLLVQSLVISGAIALGHTVAPGLSDDVLAPAAKVCATVVGMVTNFLGYRWIFRNR